MLSPFGGTLTKRGGAQELFPKKGCLSVQSQAKAPENRLAPRRAPYPYMKDQRHLSIPYFQKGYSICVVETSFKRSVLTQLLDGGHFPRVAHLVAHGAGGLKARTLRTPGDSPGGTLWIGRKHPRPFPKRLESGVKYLRVPKRPGPLHPSLFQA